MTAPGQHHTVQETVLAVNPEHSLDPTLQGEWTNVQVVPETVQTYWRSVLDRVDKPNARRLLSDLDISQPLGVRQVVPARKSSAPPMYEFFLETKARHPLAVLLVRVITPRTPSSKKYFCPCLIVGTKNASLVSGFYKWYYAFH